MADADRDMQGGRDAAAVLPFLAIVLLVPPVVMIFTAPVTIAGVPLIVIYIFGVWAALVLAALLVARRLARAGGEDGAERDGRA